MTTDTANPTDTSDAAQKVYTPPPRGNRAAFIALGVYGFFVALLGTAGVIAFNVTVAAQDAAYVVQIDLIQGQALSEYDIVLDDEQADNLLTHGGYAHVVDGTSEAILILADDSDVTSGHIELNIYLPVEDAHDHEH
jgi:hypothetical protein